jgi:phospholipase C
MRIRLRRFSTAVMASLTIFAAGPAAAGHADREEDPLAAINHLVVIYLENRSFDNLYGLFPEANGLGEVDEGEATQVDLEGIPFKCLQQVDPELTSPPLPADVCSTAKGDPINSHFENAPFAIDEFIPADERTRDLVHRFYQEQVQIDGGKMDRFVAVSDARGLSVGFYHTGSLPVAREAARFTVADNFFHAAFGGSFLNHAWLICACTPVFPDAVRDGGPNDLHSVVGPNGLPVPGRDRQLTDVREGDFAVNTIEPPFPPFRSGARLPAQTFPTIGDRLTAAGVSWAWYSQGWNKAAAGQPDPAFTPHHQPFNYFAQYAPGTAGRTHLQDEEDFLAAAEAGTLPSVSFVKPDALHNEHPGFGRNGDLLTGEQHTIDLINAVRNGPNWAETAIVITYDENGGFWDHAAPPSDPRHADRWGPGTRVPAIIVSPLARRHFVDHTRYDTTSILATIEHRWHLEPLGTRDAGANDLRNAFRRGD